MKKVFSKIINRIKRIEPKKRIYLTRESIYLLVINRFNIIGAPELNVEVLQKLKSNKSFLYELILSNKDKKEIIDSADRLCRGEFRLYNLNPESFINNLNWHKDYYSGHVWPLTVFHKIHDFNDSGIDLNVPFELSRFQFVPTLIQAYQRTMDRKYTKRIIDLIDDWEKRNPYGYGIHWWSCMEVGLRAINFLLAIVFLSDLIDSVKLKKYCDLLWKHAHYIYRYDIKMGMVANKNNHYLGALLGLLASSMCFKGETANLFLKIVKREFAKEISRQFHEDGGNFESSTAYHQFSLEIILVAIILFRDYENNHSDSFVDHCFGLNTSHLLKKSLQLSGDYMSCLGYSPHFGDSSDCRVIVLDNYFKRKASDHNFLKGLGRIAFNQHYCDNEKVLRAYKKSGYCFFKNKTYGIATFAAPKGTQGTGGHGHNDKCSFVMQVKGIPVFIDPGTYIYNPLIQERFNFKKTCAHNTVEIDNQEQCHITPWNVFGLKSDISTVTNIDATLATLKMSHDGYTRFENIGVVSRQIQCKEKKLVINDHIDGSGTHIISATFNVHPECNVKKYEKFCEIENGIAFLRIYFQDCFAIEVNQSEYSDSYHHKVNNEIIKISLVTVLPFSWQTIIEVG